MDFLNLASRNGLHHVRIAESSIKYTLFVTLLSQFEYLRMSFGLINAPRVFQRYINIIFFDLIRKGQVLVYLGDILIATGTVEEHLNILRNKIP